MKRAFLKRPLTLYRLGTLLLLTFSLTGGKILTPGEIMWQESVLYRIEGHQFQQQGNLEQAATAYRKAVTVNPSYAEAYNDLGVVLESMEDFSHAEEAYQTALKFKPDLASAHSNLALLYEETNRVKEAAVHWGARVRLGPPDGAWVIKAREKLMKYQCAVPETVVEKTAKKAKEIRLAIEVGKAHLEGKQYDKAIAEFERALKMDPTNGEAARLLRLAKTRAQQDQSRQVRELEAAQGRVREEAGTLQRKEQARKAEIERERFQREQLKGVQKQKAQETVKQMQEIEEARKAEIERERFQKEQLKRVQKQKAQETVKQMKEIDEARKKAADAERKAQEAESQRMIEAAKRIEAEKRVAVEEKVREKEKVTRQWEEAKRQAAEAERRSKIARKAAEAARMAASAADQTYQAARQTVEAARETEAMVKQAGVTHQEAVKVPAQIAVPVKKSTAAPPAKRPAPAPPASASAEAQAIAREIIKERSKVQGQTEKELNRRAVAATREDRYQDAADIYKQILILDPGNRSAKQGLERAQKALAKEAR